MRKKLLALLLAFVGCIALSFGLAACDFIGGNEQGGNSNNGGNQGNEQDEEHVHTLIHVEAIEATCTEAGNSEYWTCSECGGYFSDENGENEIWDMSSIFLPIDENNHNWGEWAVTIEATCTQEGEETRVCSHDSSHIETRIIEILGHNFENGVCTRCGTLEPTEGLE